MPANLTPAYEKAEQGYREAATDEERLEALQEMLRTIPKHKGTEKLQADIKRRISHLRKAEVKGKKTRGTDPFHVPKSGAGQVIFIGAPNVGKSAIVAATTNAPVKVADYPYTTPLPTPGMALYEDAQIQLVDTPPLTADHVPPGLTATIRFADVVCIVIDTTADALEQADLVLGLFEARGLTVRSAARNELDPSDRSTLCGILVANKIDAADADTLATLRELYADRIEILPVSAESGEGLDHLLKRLWELLAVVRAYTKQPGKPPENTEPFTLPIGSTIEDLAREIHRELPEKMKYARIWGDGRYEGQQVHRTEILHDKDVVEIHE